MQYKLTHSTTTFEWPHGNLIGIEPLVTNEKLHSIAFTVVTVGKLPELQDYKMHYNSDLWAATHYITKYLLKDMLGMHSHFMQ